MNVFLKQISIVLRIRMQKAKIEEEHAYASLILSVINIIADYIYRSTIFWSKI